MASIPCRRGGGRGCHAQALGNGGFHDLELAFHGGARVGHQLVDQHLLHLAAELLDQTVRYAGERVQFGEPIGGFQAVKHRIVDAHLAVERARSLTRYAALLLAEGEASGAFLAAHRAKGTASEAASGAARLGMA